jgi:hypothetical protein
MNKVFYAKNLAGDIREISYTNIDSIPILIEEAFGKTPLYKPIWIDEEGNEFIIPRDGETVYILYRYINVRVIFVFKFILQDLGDRNNGIYEEYTLLIIKEDMEDLYEDICITFYKRRDGIFYSERAEIDIMEEDEGGSMKYIIGPPIGETFKSIKDLFLSFKDKYENIPEDFFAHLALMSICAYNRRNDF